MNLRERKRSLREAILAGRDGLDPNWREQASRAIAARIQAMDRFAAARVVLLTLPFRSEWNAMLVVAHALATGKVVVAPRVDPPARMLRVYRIADPDRDLETGYHGIPEPRTSCPEVALDRVDWVLVPGVAFDACGRRLGYGGGFYDRMLPFIAKGASRVAGAFEMQIVDEVPMAPHDVGVDAVVTEQRTLDCASMPA